MRIAAVCLTERSFAKYYDPNGVDLKAGDFCVVEDKQIAEAVGRVSMFESRSSAQLRQAELPWPFGRAPWPVQIGPAPGK